MDNKPLQALNFKYWIFLPSLPNVRWGSILAIETSCDDTSVCVLDHSSSKVLFHETINQDEIHEPHGGIVPRLAAVHHRKQLPILLKKALFTHRNTIDYIAATRGPGIGSSLSVGWTTALTCSIILDRPLIPIHHMEGHLLMPFFSTAFSIPKFPFLTLLVSGGHTMWVEVTNIGRYSIIGSTLDDSIGDAFDKGGRFLNLSWAKDSSYGAALEQAASLANGEKNVYPFPLPLARVKNANFSFSGLKTKLFSYSVNEADVPDLAFAYQKAIIRHVINRMGNIPNLSDRYSALVVSGGVAKNSALINALKEKATYFPVITPIQEYCTDNSLMIANAASIRLSNDKAEFVDQQDGSEYFTSWSLESLF